jgi:hypothetical protein
LDNGKSEEEWLPSGHTTQREHGSQDTKTKTDKNKAKQDDKAKCVSTAAALFSYLGHAHFKSFGRGPSLLRFSAVSSVPPDMCQKSTSVKIHHATIIPRFHIK